MLEHCATYEAWQRAKEEVFRAGGGDHVEEAMEEAAGGYSTNEVEARNVIVISWSSSFEDLKTWTIIVY